MKIIKAIRLGWIKPHPGAHKPRVYMLWDEIDQVGRDGVVCACACACVCV